MFPNRPPYVSRQAPIFCIISQLIYIHSYTFNFSIWNSRYSYLYGKDSIFELVHNIEVHQNQILSICSAAAKWKRKFSVAGGNRFCFRASELRVGFSLPSETSVSEAKVVKISFVFREISLKNRKTSNHELCIVYYNVLTYTYLKKYRTKRKQWWIVHFK